MHRVTLASQKTDSDVAYIAIAIKEVASQQRHIGLVHRDGDQLLLLHLGWNHDLRNHPASKSYFWVDPPIHPRRLKQVATICRKIWRANGADIPYGLSPPSDCFDHETGKFLLGPTRHGLTCATFVLAVFELAGLPLVQYNTWPIGRDGDKEWQEFVLHQLEMDNASEEHLEAVRKGVGGVRLRPEEVAASSTKSKLPVKFKVAERLSQLLLRKIRQ